MNYRLKLALGCILAAAATSSHATNLLEVYEKAKQADPTIRQADANRLAARENKPQALADLLPNLSGSASGGWQQSDSSGNRTVPIGNDPATGQPIYVTVNSTSTQTTNSRGWTATLTQSIFSWDRWVALKRADAQVAQAEATYAAAEQDLIVRVAQRYFAVLSAKDTVDSTQAALEAFNRQLEQAEKRFEVGLIAITDVQETRAQRDRAAADLIDAKRALATNIELLREITGEEMSNLAEPGDDMPLKNPDPASQDKWVNAALEQNLALISARLGAEIASENVRVARAGHLPSLSLTARHDYGNTNSELEAAGLIRPSSGNTTTNSLNLQLNVPIFSGGATQSRVRQNVYLQRAARENVEAVTRQTERAVRDNYLGVLSGISRVQALKQALESSRTSLQATEAGFEVGTRTTVDVLQSRQTLYAAQTAYAQSKYAYLQSLIQLEQAAGQLNKDDVVEISGWLKEPPAKQ